MMDVNKNTYTFIFASILVVVVAAILSFLSVSLTPKQEANIVKEKKQYILKAVGITVGSLLFVLTIALFLSISSNFTGEEPFSFLEMLSEKGIPEGNYQVTQALPDEKWPTRTISPNGALRFSAVG